MVLFVNPLTLRVKPWVIQSFLTFDSMDRTLKCDIHWKAVEQYFTVVLFVFQSYPVCKLGKFINFGLRTVRSEGVQDLRLRFYIRHLNLGMKELKAASVQLVKGARHHRQKKKGGGLGTSQ